MGKFSKIVKEYGGFAALSNYVDNERLEKYCDSIYLQYCKLYEKTTYLEKVKWILRHYNACKKVTLAALFYTQTKYLSEHNVKNLCYYSMYYSLFNSVLSNIYMLPQLTLGNVRSVSHSKIFTYVDNYLVKPGIYPEEILNTLSILRMMREAYSYHLPISGFDTEHYDLTITTSLQKLTDLLPVILQVSNMISFLSYFAWKKKIGQYTDEYDKYSNAVDALFMSFVTYSDSKDICVVMDEGDYQRQGYALYRMNEAFPLSWFIMQKMSDDLEGGWEYEEGKGFDINTVTSYLSDVFE